MKTKTAGWVMALLLVATPALAHVTVRPRESKLGATETYTVNVPSEGGKTTTAVMLEVPDGVSVVSVAAPEGAKHEEKKSGDRIVSMTWTMEIKAGERAAFTFVAKNPATGASLTWKVMQHYADATTSSWTPATTLLPAEVALSTGAGAQ
ncbi:MAG: DUF1775 domain-containing protein, partial [Vicinamibacterales bacterium]